MTLFFVFIAAAAIIWTKKQICNSLFYLYLFYIANARIYLFIHIARQWIALCVCRLHKMNERTNERCIHHLAGDCSFALSPFQLKRFLYSLIFSYFTLFFCLQLPSKHMCNSFTCCVSVFRKRVLNAQTQTPSMMFGQEKLLSHFKHTRQIVPFDEWCYGQTKKVC